MKFFKFLSALAFVAAAGALAGTWFLYQRYVAEHTARTSLESHQVQLEEQNASLETQVARLPQYEQEVERLRGQIKEQVGQRDSLKKELDDAYGKISGLKKQIQNLEAEKQTLNNQLNVGQATDTAIVREAAKLAVPPAPSLPAAGPAAVKPQTKPSEKPKATKEPEASKVIDIKETKGVKTAANSKEPVAPATTDQRPLQVLSVNRQFKFVVVNVGLRGNLKVGDTLRVEQGGKLIGRIQVEKLYENFSACNIIEENKSAQIREGDLVRIA